jgi:hypothetical protein
MSYVVMDSETVRKMAETAKKNLFEAREQRVHEECNRERDRVVTRFWAKLTRKPLPTDEEILESSSGSFHTVSLVSSCWYDDEVTFNQLSTAANYATSVSVSAEDLRQLETWQ